MTIDAEGGGNSLSADDAFAVLGNETRMEILQTLGEADEPLLFSELRERVGVRDSGRFNYHLDQLTGHFLEKTDTGYDLGQAGQRVIEAVLSGTVTESPVIERTEIDWTCHYCGAPSVAVDYRQEQVGMYCSQCEGTYRGSRDATERAVPAEQDRLGYLTLPPAGIHGRTPEEVLQAAYIWYLSEMVTETRGICPQCSAPVTESVSVCKGHDATGGVCDECDRRYAVASWTQCTNCIHNRSTVFGVRLLTNPDLRGFFLNHGLDMGSPSSKRLRQVISVYEEEVLKTDPFTARFTFSIGGDAITLTVDDDLTVVDATRHKISESA